MLLSYLHCCCEGLEHPEWQSSDGVCEGPQRGRDVCCVLAGRRTGPQRLIRYTGQVLESGCCRTASICTLLSVMRAGGFCTQLCRCRLRRWKSFRVVVLVSCWIAVGYGYFVNQPSPCKCMIVVAAPASIGYLLMHDWFAVTWSCVLEHCHRSVRRVLCAVLCCSQDPRAEIRQDAEGVSRAHGLRE